MSVDTAGTQGYTNANPPSGDFSVMGWFQFLADPPAAANMFGVGTATASQRTAVGLNPSDQVLGIHDGTFTSSLFTEDYGGTWRYVLLHYQVETGGGGNGVLTIKYLDDGDTAFQSTQTVTGLSDAAARSAILVNTSRSDTFSVGGDLLIGPLKYTTGIISDADALTERLYRHNQTGSEHATYPWASSGTLTDDVSANGYDLTGLGSGGAYSSTEPSAILGDNPPDVLDQGGSAPHHNHVESERANVTVYMRERFQKLGSLFVPDRRLLVPVGVSL